MISALLKALRPAQWVKNFFVLAPLVFGGKLLMLPWALRGAAAFGLFCAAASAVYLLNDIRDREEDRQHPAKRHRPIASGRLPVPVAYVVAILLVLVATVGGWLLTPVVGALIFTYLAINWAYSFGAKRVVILDLMIVAVGFVLRVEAGSAAVGVVTSRWLILCTAFVALFLVMSKRRHELTLLADGAASQRSVLHLYSVPFLDQMINVVTASTLVCYALYTVDPETVSKFGTQHLVYTVPLVLFGIFRYLYLIHRGTGNTTPTEAILTDLPFVLNVILWVIVVVAIVYLPKWMPA
ncbi:MAG: decaprenyl-phosphate phosphoribosyltransferase [Acidobacteriota bacterium]